MCVCVCVCVCVDQVRTEEVSLNSSMLELQFAGEDLDKKVGVGHGCGQELGVVVDRD